MLKNILHQKHLYLLLVFIPIIIGIIGFVALMDSPYTGLHFEQRNDKWYVSSIDSNSPASKYSDLVGKEVVMIGDWKLEKYDLVEYLDDIKNRNDYDHFWASQTYLNHYVKPGSVVELTINKLEKIRITSSSISLPHLISTNIISLAIFVFALLVGLLVVFKKPENVHARVLFLMILAMGVYIMTVMLYTSRDIVLNTNIFKFLVMLNSLAGTYIGVTLLHFSFIFPKARSYVYNKIIFPIIYILPLLILYLYQMRISWESHYLFTFICLIGAVAVIIHTFVTLHSPAERAQIKIVLWGTALFLVSASSMHLFPILILGHRIFSDAALFPLILIIPVFVTFSIFRYGLMDIDTLFDNTLIYSVTIGLLALIDITVVYILASNKIPLLVFKEPFPTIIAVWVIIFTYIPVRNRVRDIIKRLLKREIYDLNEVSLSFGKSLLAIQSVHEISEATKQVIGSTLHPREIHIELFPTPQSVQMTVNADDGGAFIPLSATTGALGVITLGEKHSGRLYDRNDIKLLDAISNQAALAIESMLYREKIKRKEEENRQEKERISKEIHDGIGSSLVQAKLLLNMGSKNPNAINEASTVIDNGIKEMRELIWVVEQDEQTLGDLIYHIEGRLEQAKNILNININTSIEDESIILTPEQKLNISRIVQESITNIIKHAQASRVDISFIQYGKDLEIIIRDNGKGFDVSKTSSESYGLRNMRARGEKIGAQFSISSEIGKGTEIKISAAI